MREIEQLEPLEIKVAGWDGKQAKSDLYSGMQIQMPIVVVSDSMQPPGLQHTRLPCPSLSLGVCSNSCPLNG